MTDQRAELFRHRPADRVGNVDGGGPGVDDRLANLHEEFGLGARSVFGRELDVARISLGAAHPFDGETDDLALGFAELELAVNLRGREENMDAGAASGRFERFASGVDILGDATGQAGDDRAFDLRGDGLHRLEVAVADHRETGFDHIDLQTGQLPGDLKLLTKIHRGSRALFSITKGGIEYDDSLCFHNV